MSAVVAPPDTSEWRSGTGKVIRVGDTVRVDPKATRSNVRGSYRFRVKEIRQHGDTVEITVFGGRPNREQFHTFVPEILHVCRGGQP